MNKQIRMIVLLENRSYRKDLSAEHGLAIWITYQDNQVLFDTGQTIALLGNARHLNIDLSSLAGVVLSHGHYDHTGGLAGVLNVAKKAEVYLHPKCMKIRYAFSEGEPARQIGISDQSLAAIRENHTRVNFVKKAQQIFPGVWLTGSIPHEVDFEPVAKKYTIDKYGEHVDTFEDDQAMVLESPLGLVIVLGCAHSGVVNTLQHIQGLFPEKHIHAVVGGMHLSQAPISQIEKTITFLKSNEIACVFPGHCTGELMENKLLLEYKEGSRTLFSGMEIFI